MSDTKISAMTAATDLSNMVLAGEALGVNKSYATSLFDARYAQLTGATFTGKLNTVASASGGAGFNLPAGAAPTTPTNGDLWTTSTAFFYRINGTTYQAATLAGTETLTNKTISGSSNTITNISLTSSVTGTLPIGNGGTNLTTYNSGDMLYASAANTLAALAKGSANQTLQMNGAGTFPVWVTVAATSGVLVGVQTFTTSGTYTPNASATKALAFVTAGGGNGAGGISGTAGGGGGAGSTTIAYITSPSTQTVTIGAAGGASSLGTITTSGGANGSSSAGGAGGASSGSGTLGLAGGDGSSGHNVTSTGGGTGGASFWGGGGKGATGSAGTAAVVYGAGGGGGGSSGTLSGGAGAGGVILVLEFK